MDRYDPQGRTALESPAQAEHRERAIRTVAQVLVNAVPDAFASIGRHPQHDAVAFDPVGDFSDYERPRFHELAAAVVRRLAPGRDRAAIHWNRMGLAGIPPVEVAMSNKPSAADTNEPNRRAIDAPLDVDPMEGGGVVPGAPPGETFGSVATTPPSEAEINERAGHRRKP